MVSVFSRDVGTTPFVGRIAAGLSVAFALAVAGCASVPPPDNAMNLAQSQLQAARDADAPDYAPVDMGFAQDKFQQAQSAMALRKYADAATLAAESQADAELAAAKGRLGTARAKIQQKVSENSRLRQDGGQATDSDSSSMMPAAAASNQLPPVAPMQDMPVPAGPSSALPDNAQGASPTNSQAKPGTAASAVLPVPSAGFQPVQPMQSPAQPAPAQSAPPVPSVQIPVGDPAQGPGVRP